MTGQARSRLGLFIPVGAALLEVAAVNAVIFGLRLPGGVGGHRLIDPPGRLVGAVWTVLFILFGLAFWRLAGRPGWYRWALGLFMAFCLSYPLYTLGLSNVRIALGGNIATLAFAIALVISFWGKARTSAALISPSIAWLSFATFATFEQLR